MAELQSTNFYFREKIEINIEMEKIEMKKISVETWYLYYDKNFEQQQSSNNELNAKLWNSPNTKEYLKLYKEVGEEWGWTGRLLLTDEELKTKLISPNNEVWRYYFKNEVIGFFEIDRSVNGDAEIVYLGLIPSETGKGFGKQLLSLAVEKAKGKNNNKVWLHTCEYDHKNALTFYIRNGFIIDNKQIDDEYYPVDFLKKFEQKSM